MSNCISKYKAVDIQRNTNQLRLIIEAYLHYKKGGFSCFRFVCFFLILIGFEIVFTFKFCVTNDKKQLFLSFKFMKKPAIAHAVQKFTKVLYIEVEWLD